MSFIRFLAWFAFSGVVIPLVFQVVWWLVNRFGVGGLDVQLSIQKLMLILWPSSLMMLPAGSDESLLPVALLLSIAANVVLYAVIGAAIWYGFKKQHVVLIFVAIAISVMWWRVLTL